jgi:hypothetical protein
MEGVTPLQVAAALRSSAAGALRLVSELRPLQGDNKELRLTLGDAEAMAHLGNYYAEKTLAASAFSCRASRNGAGPLEEISRCGN